MNIGGPFQTQHKDEIEIEIINTSLNVKNPNGTKCKFTSRLNVWAEWKFAIVRSNNNLLCHNLK